MASRILARAMFLLALASFVGCSDGVATPVSATPVVPTVSTPAAPPTANVLSGIVFESTATGRTPVAGVEVYCDACGSPNGHTFAYSDAAGAYSFSWTYDGQVPLLIRKDGYSVSGATAGFPEGTGRHVVTVRGDTRFDIELVRR
jgi:hypothetical protein